MSIPINIILNNHTYYHNGNNKFVEAIKEQAKPLDVMLFGSKDEAIDAINKDPDKFYNGMIVMIACCNFIDPYMISRDEDGNTNLSIIEEDNEVDLSELEGVIE